MKILCDTHCHTLANPHAFSTVHELVTMAKEKGLELIAITDHGPEMPDSIHEWHFHTLGHIPREVMGVKVLRGIEANVLDSEGRVDISPAFEKQLDIAIASMHTQVYAPLTKEEHTRAWLGVLDDSRIDILGHIGDPRFDFDYEMVLSKVKEKNRMIEINSSSSKTRKGSFEVCTEILKICKRLGVKIVVSSDAHICYNVGEFSKAYEILELVDFPPELIMNTTAGKLLAHLNEYKNIK